MLEFCLRNLLEILKVEFDFALFAPFRGYVNIRFWNSDFGFDLTIG